MTAAVLVVAMLLGGLAQRATGMGFALIAAPLLVVALGPWDGVVMVSLGGSVISLCLTWLLRADIDWQRVEVVGLYALAGVLPGTWLAYIAPARWLQFAIGLALVVTLTLGMLTGRRELTDGPALRVSTGLATGLVNATAGAAGPVLAAYGAAVRWAPSRFIASIQPIFAAIGLATIGSRWLASGSLWPALPVSLWVAAATAVIVGVLIGGALARRVPEHRLRIGTLSVAYVGSVLTVVSALVG